MFSPHALMAVATDPWADFFFGIESHQRFVLLIIGIGCLTGIIIVAVTTVCGLIGSLHRRRLETELKREMLDRGMSAEEIASVVESSQPRDFLERWASGKSQGGKV